MSHLINGLLLRRPATLAPRGDFTTPARLVTILDDDSGGVFSLMATDEAAAALDLAGTPCRVAVELRATPVDLAALSSGTRRGCAWKLRVARRRRHRRGEAMSRHTERGTRELLKLRACSLILTTRCTS
jgi:hypothetical protein